MRYTLLFEFSFIIRESNEGISNELTVTLATKRHSAPDKNHKMKAKL